MKKIFVCTLFFIIALGFVPTSASNVPDEYQTYIETINGSGFFWSDYTNTYNEGGYTQTVYVLPCSDYSWFTVGNVANLNNNTNILDYDGSSHCYASNIIDLYITSSGESFSISTNLSPISVTGINDWNGQTWNTCYFPISRDYIELRGNASSFSYTFNATGSLSDIFSLIAKNFRNVNIYVDGVRWASVGSSYSIETEIELPCDIQAVDSSFNFFNGGYGVTWKQGQYNWTQTGPLENITRTMVWTVSYPTVSYVQSLYNQSFVDTTPLDVVRNAFNTVFNEGTSIYDIPEQYRATTNFFINIDSPELGSSYHTSYDSTTQQWALTQNEYSYSLVNGYQFNTGFFKQLYQLYGDADLFSIALCYITPVRVSMYAVDDTQGIIYNPLSIYWLDLKQSNGTVLEYRNFGSQTTVTDDNVTDDTTSNDSVTGDDTPFVNPTDDQLNTNYNNSIQNSYNHTVNNYYNYNDINTDLLDYYLSFRDGGTEQDVQDAFGYLNATISSLSNVPVVLHNLFYNFFPLPVVRLMQALFIVFMVFMIIIIIKHLFR